MNDQLQKPDAGEVLTNMFRLLKLTGMSNADAARVVADAVRAAMEGPTNG